MKNNRRWLILLFLTLVVLCSACSTTDNTTNTTKISMDDLRELAQAGEDLTWEDFEDYPSEDVGSGLYIRKYEMDGGYHVLVGGGSLNTSPSYIYLVNADGEQIDLRKDDIDQVVMN